METVKVKLDEGARMPKKAHFRDAGFDIFAKDRTTVKAGKSEILDTGVHIAIPSGYCGFLKSKSGLNCKFSLLNEGVIDADYTGSIKVKMYNFSENDYTFEIGDKISQIVFLPIPTFTLVEVDELSETERGNGGFGSTGR